MFAQVGDVYWKDVAPIFYNNCSTCHRPGEIGSPYLMIMSYGSLLHSNISYVSEIPVQVQSRLMPPWKADPHYRQFIDQRYLRQGQIDTVAAWINNGAPAGDTTLAPPPPVFATGSQLGTPDIVLKMSQVYHVPANDSDHYEVFVLPLPASITENTDATAIEFRPGNGKAVHHVFVYNCTDSSAYYADKATPEYGYPSFGGLGANGDFLGLWAPGMNTRFYPLNGGVTLKPHGFIAIQIHYAPTTDTARYDQSSVNIFLAKDPIERHAKAKRVGENYLTAPGLYILNNKVMTFYLNYRIDTDLTLFGIAPHCHLLGKSNLLFDKTKDGDTIPLVWVPQWAFNWQLLYSFPYAIHLKPGDTLKGAYTYDNTTNNPLNPNNPPINVHYGESSHDEMFKFLMQYYFYQPGDENILLDPNWKPIDFGQETGVNPVPDIVKSPQLYPCSPNPTGGQTLVKFYLPAASNNVTLYIYDLTGHLVATPIMHESRGQGFQYSTIDLSKFASGVYLYSLSVDTWTKTKQLIVQN